MTGGGFDTSFFGPYAMAWLAMVVLFFIVVFARKWVGEAFDMPFSTIGAFVGAYVPYLVVVTVTCAPKWALLSGIVGFIIGAFFLGSLFGDSGGY